MVRKNFFITEIQDRWLTRTAKKSGLSEAELMRRILDYIVERDEIIDEIMYRRIKNENKSKR